MNTRLLFNISAMIEMLTGIAQESGKMLASTLDVFVFPTEGQAADLQSIDEAECYSWAANKTGSDPFDLQKQSEQQAQQTEAQVQQAQNATQGAGAQGAAQQQATAEQIDNFKKAFSVCLEAKEYMVKY